MNKKIITIIVFMLILILASTALSAVTSVVNSSNTLINPSTSDNQTNGNQKTKVVDGSGNTISADTDSDGTWHLGVSMIQDSKPISQNSSTTNLASGATFTGTSVSSIGANAIQVSLKTDVNALVYIEQSSDGTNWDLSDSFNYYYSLNNFSITVQAVSSYFRVRVTNSSTVSSTYFRLQSVICPMVEAIPRSLDTHGHFKTHVFGSTDEYGFDAENTPNGEQRVINPTLLVGTLFEGSVIDPNFWVVTTSSGTVTQQNDSILISSTTSSIGSAKLHSVRRARYAPGQAHVARFQLSTNNTGTTSNLRRWGTTWGSSMPNFTDGAYFELNGTTFSIVTTKGSSTTIVSSGNFNGTYGSTYALDTNIHTYEIYWNNRYVFFTIDGEVLHSIRSTNATWSNTVQFHVYLESTNTGTVGDNTITCSSAGIRRLGSLLSQPTSTYQSGTVASVVLKYGSGNLHSVVISGVTNNSVVTLYDNTAASGRVLFSSGAMSNSTTPFAIDLKGLPFFTGLTLSITAANSNATVIYE